MKKMIFVFLIVIISNSYSQSLGCFPKGLGIEIGLGYNQLKHQEIPIEPFFSSETYSRNKFKLTPTIRLSYDKEVIANFSLMPFIGYSIIGGKSDKKANGYEDEIKFNTLGIGLFASYNFHIVSVSIGSKYNRFLKITNRSFGNLYDPISLREWKDNDMSDIFKKWSIDLGGRTSYTLSNFTFAIEAWFSITELSSKIAEDVVNVSSRRFQALVGYRL
jgi:hypothetical protein